MKILRILFLFCAVGFSSQSLAGSSGAQLKDTALEIYRDWVPTSQGLNKAIAQMAGVPVSKVQDLSNTYVLANAQWVLYQLLRKTSLEQGRRDNIAGFLVIHHLLYLSFVTLNYVAGGLQEARMGDVAVFAVNAVAAYHWAKWWRNHFEYTVR